MYSIKLQTPIAITNHYDYPEMTREVSMIAISNDSGIAENDFYTNNFTMHVYVVSKLNGKVVKSLFEEYRLSALDIPVGFEIPVSLEQNPTTFKKIDVATGQKVLPYIIPTNTVGMKYQSKGNLVPVDSNGDFLDWDTEVIVTNQEAIDEGLLQTPQVIVTPKTRTIRKTNPNWNAPQNVSEGMYWNGAVASGNLDVNQIAPIIRDENDLGRFDFQENTIRQ